MKPRYAQHKPSHGRIDTEGVVHHERDHYEVLQVGWDGTGRVHGCVAHVDLIGDKVWVQYDGTSRAFADELVAAGIPPEDIVLGFHPAEPTDCFRWSTTSGGNLANEHR